MPNAKEQIDTCFICNKLNRTYRHYGELMCNTCYHLCQRMRAKHRRETGRDMDRDDTLRKAITRRAELMESGKWEKDHAKKLPNIRIITGK